MAKSINVRFSRSRSVPVFNNKHQAWLNQLDQKALSAWVHQQSLPSELPDHFLARPRLLEAIDEGPDITWLLAPAGFGKSTALSHWFREKEQQQNTIAVWLSLGTKDNSPIFFLAPCPRDHGTGDAGFSDRCPGT